MLLLFGSISNLPFSREMSVEKVNFEKLSG